MTWYMVKFVAEAEVEVEAETEAEAKQKARKQLDPDVNWDLLGIEDFDNV